MKMHSVSCPHLNSIFGNKNLIDFFFKGHYHSLKPCFQVIASRIIASDIPMNGFGFSFRNVVDCLNEALLLFFHNGERKPIGEFKSAGEIFKSVRFGIVNNKHLNIKHFLEPCYFAANYEIHIFADRVDNDFFLFFFRLNNEVSTVT